MSVGIFLFYFYATFAQETSFQPPQVPQDLWEEAVGYYETHQDQIHNQQFMTVVDYNQHSREKRLYIVNMMTQKVESYLVSHGRNSDPDGDGWATEFSNVIDSKQSSLGVYITAESYVGKYGYSMALDGISLTNSNARVRAIVMHPASYVSEADHFAGRSWGCFAIDPLFHEVIINQIKEGSVFYVGLSH